MQTPIQVLIVDDEAVIGHILKEELERFGFQGYSVQSGQEALQLMEGHDFDAALIDINMPQMNGFAVLKEFRVKQPGTIIFMITANGSIESAVQAMKLGAQDYITKPFDSEMIVAKLQQIFSERRPLAPRAVSGGAKEGQFYRSESLAMQDIYRRADKVKNMKSTVLICGESGTGKGVLAKYMHNTSNRKEEPFIHVDCATIPENLMESELFGHEKGAFTGASKQHHGKFEQAKRGTLFLDEISAIPKNLQSKMLITLQERAFYRVGGDRLVYSEARIIAATNDNLEERVANGQFREDLFYRLNIVQINLPPLRQRRQDIPHMAEFFLRKFCESNEIDRMSFLPETMECLTNYNWPGNVRELENAVESACVLSEGGIVQPKDLPLRILEFVPAGQTARTADRDFSLDTQEMLTIIAALEKCGGHREKAAKMLGISRRSLQYKIKKMGLLGLV